MIRDDVAIAREAAKAALLLRHSQGIPFDKALCVWDLAEAMGVEVTFDGSNSFSGMYVNCSPPRILIGARRPPGRKSTTCAHELGHHQFGHGTRADEYLGDDERDERFDPEERMANAFASNLLMPAAAVRRAFRLRSWSEADPSPAQAFTVAEALGVGYSTLLAHLSTGMRVLPWRAAEKLRHVRPKDIQADLWPQETVGRVVPVDPAWVDRPIDLEVGDVVLLPEDVTFVDPILENLGVHHGRTAAAARESGVVAVETPNGWNGTVRISRHHYVGRSRWRHLPDPDPDPDPEGSDVP